MIFVYNRHIENNLLLRSKAFFMSSVSKDDQNRKVINKMKETPSVGRYKPKYDFVDKRPPTFLYHKEHAKRRPRSFNKYNFHL